MMSYPYGNFKFGVTIDPQLENVLGSIAERNLRELFDGSSECLVPDQLVEPPRSQFVMDPEGHFRPPSGLFSSDFGLDDVGYTEYTQCRYLFCVPDFGLPSIRFEPDDIQSLDPMLVMKELEEAFQAGLKKWELQINRVNPTALFWKYVSADGLCLPPRLLKITLSN